MSRYIDVQLLSFQRIAAPLIKRKHVKGCVSLLMNVWLKYNSQELGSIKIILTIGGIPVIRFFIKTTAVKGSKYCLTRHGRTALSGVSCPPDRSIKNKKKHTCIISNCLLTSLLAAWYGIITLRGVWLSISGRMHDIWSEC